MSALAIPLLLAIFQEGEVVQFDVTFESMHCAECRTELDRAAKRLAGLKSAKIVGKKLLLSLSESAAIPTLDKFPKDLKVRDTLLTLRGTVVFTKKKVSFVAKGSGATFALANPTRPPADRLGELRARKGGRNRFRISGSLTGRKTIVLASFRKAEWKD